MSQWFHEKLIHIHIELLNKFDDNATEEIFEQIFGETIGKHLWNKYIRSSSGFICVLYRYLDDNNREKLCEYLNNQGT
jgi:hypothetical protein